MQVEFWIMNQMELETHWRESRALTVRSLTQNGGMGEGIGHEKESEQPALLY